MKLKKLAKIIGGLLVLIIIALIALPFFISAEYLKGQLQQQVKAATGRDLIIKGNTSLKVFPNIAVSAEDVTLGNPAGFSSPYFVQLKKLETGAALVPLLSKDLQITGITLEGAVLNMEELASGAKNWEFKSAPTKEEPAPKKEPTASSPLKALAIGDIVLKDSAVNMIKPGKKTTVVKDINLTISGADGSKALKVDGSALLDGKSVKANVSAEKMKALLAGESSPLKADITLPMGNVKFNGTASNNKALALDGAVDLTMDAIKATGKLAVNMGGAVPSVKGALKMDELNLDKVTGGGTKEAPAKEPAAGQDGWSDEKIDLSALRAANADLDISIGKLISGKLEVSNIAANVALNDGALKVTLSNASLYSGTAKGTVSAGAGGSIGTNLSLSGIEIDPLMTALVGKSRLEGKANVTLNVNGGGGSQKAIVGSLNGNGSFSVVDGAFKGINIASFLRDAKKGFLADSSSEKTDFSELTGTYTIAQGVVTNNDLSMKSPVLRVAGKGTASLPAKTVNYRVEPTLVSTLKGQGDVKDRSGLTIPMVIAGPWSNISITPDLAGMLQEGLKDPAKLKENLKDIKGSIKDLNSPKDIGKALFGGKEAAPATSAPAATPAAAPATTTPAAEPAPAAAPAPAKKSDATKEAIGGLLNSLGKKE